MNYFTHISVALALIGAVRNANGHGTPIQVQPGTSLIATGGTADSAGFASMLFFESTDSGDPFATLALPTVGPVVVWQIPGFEINGLDTTSSLSIEILSRPVNNALPIQYRSLWYWNPATSEVVPTSAPLYLLGSGQRSTMIDPASPPPATFLMVDQVGGTQAEGGQQGFHNHGLLSYALDNDHAPPADAGAYGFFARLTSNNYAASNPFLVVLNRGVDYERMAEAALAINAAAFLPGDFNHDDRVDAADYVIWRDNAETAQDYQLWRGGFGATVSGSGSSVGTASVPEPASLLIVGTIVGALASSPRRRR